MVTFEGMRVFAKVADAGSLSGAARLLGLTPSAISRQISALEDQLGAQLFNRTTRKIALTDVGRGYLERCRRILADVEEATEAVTSLNATPRGPLRVNMPAVCSAACISRPRWARSCASIPTSRSTWR